MRNGNEVETICDTAIRLLINSVTKQLLTEIMTNTQLSDFLISGMILNELLIDGDNRRSVKETRAMLQRLRYLPSFHILYLDFAPFFFF